MDKTENGECRHRWNISSDLPFGFVRCQRCKIVKSLIDIPPKELDNNIMKDVAITLLQSEFKEYSKILYIIHHTVMKHKIGSIMAFYKNEVDLLKNLVKYFEDRLRIIDSDVTMNDLIKELENCNEEVIDGEIHYLEPLFNRIANSYSIELFEYIDSLIFSKNEQDEYKLEILLRLLGRVKFEDVSYWATILITRALKHSYCKIREAAIQAIENWEDEAIAEIFLTCYNDKVSWLQDYAKQVRDGLVKKEQRR